MSKSKGVEVTPIGAEEYILICKKVSDKIRSSPGTENDSLAQSFISITDTIYTKLNNGTLNEGVEQVKKGFLICPVRGVDPKETEDIVKDIEAKGIEVHWPHRDTNQDDPIGFDICTQNRNAIKEADVIYVVWDGKSQGCLFDLGIAFSMNKKIQIINIPDETEQKSFQNMMRFWEDQI